jgi:nucleoside-diphosphate-sugar epimerase
VLVTGAAGFVGCALCGHLAQHGIEVSRALRRPALATLHPPEVRRAPAGDIVVGDIGPDTAWDAALAGIDVVVHLAARVHVMDDKARDPLAEFRRVNVEGTRALAEAAARAGVRRLVFLSSVKVHGESTTRPFVESDPPRPEDLYGISKWEAEQALAEVGRRTGIQYVILRPPLVYGPGVRANFLRLMRAVAAGVPLPFGAVENRRSLVFAGNLVDATRRCLEGQAVAGRTYLVNDGAALSTPDLVRRLAAALGVRPRLVPVPVRAMTAAARLLGKGGTLRRLTGSLEVDASALGRDLGWSPPFDVDTGLARTVSWLREVDHDG